MRRRQRDAGLAVRERWHRRRVLAGVVLLVVLAALPLVADPASLGLADGLAGRNHLWALCMIALHAVLAPVHGLFHVLLGVGVGFALLDRVRAFVRARRVLGVLPAVGPPPGGAIHGAAVSAGIDPATVRVVPGLADPAFTAGGFRPLVYVAAELPERLTSRELTAVLKHEFAHVRRRDPLRLSALRFIAATLFWLPALRGLADDLRDEVEIAADDAAATDPAGLASALLSLAAWTPPGTLGMAGSVGFRRDDLLERRVRRLAGADARPRTRVSSRSAAVTAAMLGLALTAAIAVSHPLPGQHPDSREHCEHHGALAILHLFCSAADTRDECRHAMRHTS